MPLRRLALAGAMVATCGAISWALPWATAAAPVGSGEPATPWAPLVPSVPVDGGSPAQLQPPTLRSLTGPQPSTATLSGIPATVLDAYRRAAARSAGLDPNCHLPWQLLAAIGKVESGHAESGDVDARGTALRPILGPVLDGSNGTAAIPAVANTINTVDTNADTWARAMGPMQFIPSTWAAWGVDVIGAGAPDPENVYDATAAAADYLCGNGRDLSTPDGVSSAILSYNNSPRYLSVVLDWFRVYANGAVPVADQIDPAAVQDAAWTSAGPTTGPTAPPSPSGQPPSGVAPAPGRPTPPPKSTPAPNPPPAPDPIGGLAGGVGAVVAPVGGALANTAGAVGSVVKVTGTLGLGHFPS
jgi:hypothetical protein